MIPYNEFKESYHFCPDALLSIVSPGAFLVFSILLANEQKSSAINEIDISKKAILDLTGFGYAKLKNILLELNELNLVKCECEKYKKSGFIINWDEICAITNFMSNISFLGRIELRDICSSNNKFTAFSNIEKDVLEDIKSKYGIKIGAKTKQVLNEYEENWCRNETSLNNKSQNCSQNRTSLDANFENWCKNETSFENNPQNWCKNVTSLSDNSGIGLKTKQVSENTKVVMFDNASHFIEKSEGKYVLNVILSSCECIVAEDHPLEIRLLESKNLQNGGFGFKTIGFSGENCRNERKYLRNDKIIPEIVEKEIKEEEKKQNEENEEKERTKEKEYKEEKIKKEEKNKEKELKDFKELLKNLKGLEIFIKDLKGLDNSERSEELSIKGVNKKNFSETFDSGKENSQVEKNFFAAEPKNDLKKIFGERYEKIFDSDDTTLSFYKKYEIDEILKGNSKNDIESFINFSVNNILDYLSVPEGEEKIDYLPASIFYKDFVLNDYFELLNDGKINSEELSADDAVKIFSKLDMFYDEDEELNVKINPQKLLKLNGFSESIHEKNPQKDKKLSRKDRNMLNFDFLDALGIVVREEEENGLESLSEAEEAMYHFKERIDDHQNMIKKPISMLENGVFLQIVDQVIEDTGVVDLDKETFIDMLNMKKDNYKRWMFREDYIDAQKVIQWNTEHNQGGAVEEELENIRNSRAA